MAPQSAESPNPSSFSRVVESRNPSRQGRFTSCVPKPKLAAPPPSPGWPQTPPQRPWSPSAHARAVLLRRSQQLPGNPRSERLKIGHYESTECAIRAIVWHAASVASAGICRVLLEQTGHSRALHTHDHAPRTFTVAQPPPPRRDWARREGDFSAHKPSNLDHSARRCWQ